MNLQNIFHCLYKTVNVFLPQSFIVVQKPHFTSKIKLWEMEDLGKMFP